MPSKPSPTKALTSADVKAEAARLGFVACGITHAAHDFGPRLRDWLAAGSHGQMGWMEDRADQRAGPQALWPEARSVIMLGMSYAPTVDPLALADLMPMLGHVGLGALDEHPYRFDVDGCECFVYDIRVRVPNGVTIDGTSSRSDTIT